MKNAIYNHLTVKNDICFRMSRPTDWLTYRRDTPSAKPSPERIFVEFAPPYLAEGGQVQPMLACFCY
jgi:hypothetical protein